MISLLPKYCLTEKLLKQLKNIEAGLSGTEAIDMKARMQLAVEEIASNVVAFCRTIISKSGVCLLLISDLYVYYTRTRTIISKFGVYV